MVFRHDQEIDAVGRVQTIQTLTVAVAPGTGPNAHGQARDAGHLYFDCLRRWGRPVLRVRTHADGGVELWALGMLLLSFTAPEIIVGPDGWHARYPIDRGVVVQPQGRGEGYLQISYTPGQVRLAVEGYYARLVGPHRNPLRVAGYLLTQSALHVLIARAFLPTLARHLPQPPRG